MSINNRRLALIGLAVGCFALGMASVTTLLRYAGHSFLVTDPAIHVWSGKTVDGEAAVCINCFAYINDSIFDDRLLVPMTGVRLDERGSGPGAAPARAVRCKS